MSEGWTALDCQTPTALPAAPFQVAVRGGTGLDHQHACEAVRRVIGFFAQAGLRPAAPLRIAFGESVHIDADGRAVLTLAGDAPPAIAGAAFPVVGLYEHDRRRILMTSSSSARLHGHRYFDLPLESSLYTSALAHEVTHALSKSLYSPGLPTSGADILVQEQYVAYAVQLATVDADIREAILRHFDAARLRFDHESDIGPAPLALDPEAFGVACYRHFTGVQGGAAFLHRIYTGQFRPLTGWGYAP